MASPQPRLVIVSVWRPLWDTKIHFYGLPNNYQFKVDELQQILAACPTLRTELSAHGSVR